MKLQTNKREIKQMNERKFKYKRKAGTDPQKHNLTQNLPYL